MSLTKIEQSVLLERLREIEDNMLAGNVHLFTPQTATMISAYLMGRGYQVLNVPEDDKIVVGIVPNSEAIVQ